MYVYIVTHFLIIHKYQSINMSYYISELEKLIPRNRKTRWENYYRKVDVLIFINNIPKFKEEILKFIYRIREYSTPRPCFYLDNVKDISSLKINLDKITKKFRNTNIIVFYFGYGTSFHCCPSITHLCLEEETEAIPFTAFYNIFAKHKTTQCAIFFFSYIVYKHWNRSTITNKYDNIILKSYDFVHFYVGLDENNLNLHLLRGMLDPRLYFKTQTCLRLIQLFIINLALFNKEKDKYIIDYTVGTADTLRTIIPSLTR